MHTRELTAAGLHDRELAAAFTCCHRYLSRGNPAAYPAARRLLPPGKRPYWDAILAVAVYVDDIIDDRTKPVTDRRARFDAYARNVFQFLSGDGPWPRSPETETEQDRLGRQFAYAFRHFLRTHDIPEQSARRFFTTIRTDLSVTEYPRHADLAEYIEGVCGENTVWGNALFGVRDEEADRRAIAASFGLQLTDYLRDLTEDLADGRLYLPLEDLRTFGLTRESVEQAAREQRMTPQLRELAEFHTERARRYFVQADDWWRLMPPDGRELARTYVRLGRQSLEQIRRSGHDIFRTRPRARLVCVTASCASFALSYARATARTWRRGPRAAPGAGSVRRAV